MKEKRFAKNLWQTIIFFFCLLTTDLIFALPDALVNLGKDLHGNVRIIKLTSSTNCAAIVPANAFISCKCCLMKATLFPPSGPKKAPFTTCSGAAPKSHPLCGVDEGNLLRREVTRFDPSDSSTYSELGSYLASLNLTPTITSLATRDKLDPGLIIAFLQDLVRDGKLTTHSAEIKAGSTCLEVISAPGGMQTLQLFVVRTTESCSVPGAVHRKVLFIVKELKKPFEEITNIETLKVFAPLVSGGFILANDEGYADRLGIALSYANAVYTGPAPAFKPHYLTVLRPAPGKPARELIAEFAQDRRSTKPDGTRRTPAEDESLLISSFETFGKFLGNFHARTALPGTFPRLLGLTHGDLHLNNVFIATGADSTIKVTVIDSETMAKSIVAPTPNWKDILKVLVYTSSHASQSGDLDLKTTEVWNKVFIKPFLKGYIQGVAFAQPGAEVTRKKSEIAASLRSILSSLWSFEVVHSNRSLFNPVKWGRYKQIVLDDLKDRDVIGGAPLTDSICSSSRAGSWCDSTQSQDVLTSED